MGEDNLSVFGSAPAPQKEDVLFRADKDWGTNACVTSWDADRLYSNGFRRAAEYLAEYVYNTGTEQDILVYPIIYLYRHHIELALKGMVELASYILDRTLTEDNRNSLARHGLLKLWQVARPLLNSVCGRADNPPFPAADLEGIDSYICQIHGHDPDGQRFRYATKKIKSPRKIGGVRATITKAPSLSSDLKLINVRVFAAAMEKLASYLEGINSWFSDLAEAHAEMKRDS